MAEAKVHDQQGEQGAGRSARRRTLPSYRLTTSPELLLDAQHTFSRYAGEEISEGDAREMLGNLTRFTLLLERWKRQELRVKAKKGESRRR